MPPNSQFQSGLDVLLARHKNWLAGRRLGLVSHPAAVGRDGMTAGERLWREPGLRLKAVFGPEHGFFGTATAGEPLGHQRHPEWRIPVFSLYGRTRRPTAAMFRALDTIVVDLQDLAARPYTFVATLRYVLETAAELKKSVVVADRPVPLPRIVDGPMLDPRFESFVGCVRAPMHYGMTPGEMALWLKRDLGLDLDLRVARMRGYRRQADRAPGWPPWIPPSPGIRSWETGRTYLATVFGEALPAIHIGRNTNLVFQVFAAPWMKSRAVCEYLNGLRLPGAAFFAHPYRTLPEGVRFDGVRLAVRDPDAFRPVRTGIAILAGLQALYGRRKVWGVAGTRPDFFDKLFGTDTVRLALLAGASAAAIGRRWESDLRRFARTRQKCLLY
jgi:uncharacterized protein YbbC (DUF1343 family)